GASAQDLLEDLRRLFRSHEPWLAADRPLSETRGLARFAAIRVARQGRSRCIRQAGAGPGLLLFAGRIGPQFAGAVARGSTAGMGAGAVHAGRLPDRKIRALRSGAAGASPQAHWRGQGDLVAPIGWR